MGDSPAAAAGTATPEAAAGIATPAATARWPALESNPEAFTKLIHSLGVPKTVALHDVFGFDPELLAFLPQPVYAMIFLYPPSKNREKRNPDDNEADPEWEKQPFFLWQHKELGNACGTIACIHALANNRSSIPIPEESSLGKYLASVEGKVPKDKGDMLEACEPIRTEQCSSAQTGQTEVNEGKVDFHFVAFVEHDGKTPVTRFAEHDGHIFELDGQKKAPVKHCKCENFPVDCGKIIQEEFMAKMEGELNFATLALAPSAE